MGLPPAFAGIDPTYAASPCSPHGHHTDHEGRAGADLIHRATTGGTIIIEAPSGERVRLEPLPEHAEDRVPGLLKDKIKVPARLFEPMSEEELKLWYGEDP